MYISIEKKTIQTDVLINFFYALRWAKAITLEKFRPAKVESWQY